MGRRKDKGWLMAGAVVLLLCMLILVPTLIKMLQQESVSSVKTVRSLTAQNLAEAALEKVEWRLGKSPDVWRQVSSSTVVAGYNLDTVYSDMADGEYKVRLTSGPGQGQITALIVARDMASRKEVQGIQAVFQTRLIVAPLYTYSSNYTGSNPHQVHWGPLVADNGFFIMISPAMANYHYPRKFSTSLIQIFSPSSYPAADGIEYFPYSTSTVRMDLMQPDLDYYRGRAIQSQVPLVMATGRIVADSAYGIASPAGSGLFLRSRNQAAGTSGCSFTFKNTSGGATGYVFQSTNSVIYFDGESDSANITTLSFDAGTFLDVEALIGANMASGNVTLTAGAPGVFGATIPVNANLEYQHATAAATWTAGGAASMSSVYATPSRCCYSISNVTIHGFVYAYANMTMAGARIVGVVGAYQVQPSVANNPSSVIYYDSNVASRIRVINPPRRVSYRDVAVAW